MSFFRRVKNLSYGIAKTTFSSTEDELRERALQEELRKTVNRPAPAASPTVAVTPEAPPPATSPTPAEPAGKTDVDGFRKRTL